MSSIKLILVGEAQVGKTAIINQYVQIFLKKNILQQLDKKNRQKKYH